MGIELVAIAEGFDMTNPYGRAMAQVANVSCQPGTNDDPRTRAAKTVKRGRLERLTRVACPPDILSDARDKRGEVPTYSGGLPVIDAMNRDHSRCGAQPSADGHRRGSAAGRLARFEPELIGAVAAVVGCYPLNPTLPQCSHLARRRHLATRAAQLRYQHRARDAPNGQ